MHEKLTEALNHISDRHIAEAAEKRRRSRRPLWIAAIAAALAVVITVSLPGTILSTRAKAVSTAKYPDYEWVYRPEIQDQALLLKDFFRENLALTLSGSEHSNPAYSPLNLYMALAVSAEITGGESREQILSALNADSMQDLRSQANLIWNGTYLDDQDQVLLANSLWLEKGLHYDETVMNTLAENYFTSVYTADLGTAGSNQAIRAWVNQQTGGLLRANADGIDLDPATVLALYSTVYFQAKWGYATEFSSRMNTDGIFHAPSGDKTVTYMNKKEYQTNYYWGEDFAAISLGLKGGSRMWFILPDENKTAADVLASGEYLDMFIHPKNQDFSYEKERHRYMKVNFTVPKFDITASGDLSEGLKTMGITDIFDPYKADFGTTVEADFPVWFTAANQATRIAIDEKGVTAASYIEFPGAGSAAPPEEVVDLILDRPFLFVITTRYNLPLFAGIVNEP